MVVSHNRHFVTQIANKIWYIEDKEIKEYPGTYDEYEYWRKKNLAEGAPAKPEQKQQKKKEDKPVAVVHPPNDSVKLKSLEKDLKKVEDEVSLLESKKVTLENEMASPEVFGDFNKLQKVQADFKKLTYDLQKATERWETIAGEIDGLSNTQK